MVLDTAWAAELTTISDVEQHGEYEHGPSCVPHDIAAIKLHDSGLCQEYRGTERGRTHDEEIGDDGLDQRRQAEQRRLPRAARVSAAGARNVCVGAKNTYTSDEDEESTTNKEQAKLARRLLAPLREHADALHEQHDIDACGTVNTPTGGKHVCRTTHRTEQTRDTARRSQSWNPMQTQPSHVRVCWKKFMEGILRRSRWTAVHV
ncbi:hypothetical protein BV25DRAFT_1530585 [Artomyces pyxidatus]|uniref:Uncharacterized protein n=1 Tax=Artomyces pyxidatus TaxID=48021 RepID=A0ACB8TD69_9AGAM|nr:hypothetical protein BV25DRAFT_1530585 [Artomyces pyxidatus]